MNNAIFLFLVIVLLILSVALVICSAQQKAKRSHYSNAYSDDYPSSSIMMVMKEPQNNVKQYSNIKATPKSTNNDFLDELNITNDIVST